MKEELESLIEEIKELIDEVKYEQIKQRKEADQRHKLYMKNISKLKEFMNIAEMTNQLFEKRILNLEKNLKIHIKNKR